MPAQRVTTSNSGANESSNNLSASSNTKNDNSSRGTSPPFWISLCHHQISISIRVKKWLCVCVCWREEGGGPSKSSWSRNDNVRALGLHLCELSGKVETHGSTLSTNLMRLQAVRSVVPDMCSCQFFHLIDLRQSTNNLRQRAWVKLV